MGRELIEYYFSGFGGMCMMLFVPQSVIMFGILTGVLVSRRMKRRRPGGGGGGGSDFTLCPDGPPGLGRTLATGYPPSAFEPGLWVWNPAPRPAQPTPAHTPDFTPACTAV